MFKVSTPTTFVIKQYRLIKSQNYVLVHYFDTANAKYLLDGP